MSFRFPASVRRRMVALTLSTLPSTNLRNHPIFLPMGSRPRSSHRMNILDDRRYVSVDFCKSAGNTRFTADGCSANHWGPRICDLQLLLPHNSRYHLIPLPQESDIVIAITTSEKVHAGGESIAHSSSSLHSRLLLRQSGAICQWP
jgi:hypothetical protein